MQHQLILKAPVQSHIPLQRYKEMKDQLYKLHCTITQIRPKIVFQSLNLHTL